MYCEIPISLGLSSTQNCYYYDDDDAIVFGLFQFFGSCKCMLSREKKIMRGFKMFLFFGMNNDANQNRNMQQSLVALCNPKLLLCSLGHFMVGLIGAKMYDVE